jgi:hypothetical protein
VSVGTTDPVDVSVEKEVRRRGMTKKHTVVEGALKVLEDVLGGYEMGLIGLCMWKYTY